MSTNVTSVKDIKREWRLIDAKGKVLGRLASEVATILMGKTKANFVPYLDGGDYVVIKNAKEIKVTGKKSEQKIYFSHSGYPGGDRRDTFAKVMAEKPEKIITHAVVGMLPKSRLGKVMIKKLHVYPGAEHPFEDKLKGEAK